MEITLSAVASGHLLDIHKIPPEMEVRDFERIATLYDLICFPSNVYSESILHNIVNDYSNACESVHSKALYKLVMAHKGFVRKRGHIRMI